jgi:hypothetical protein
MEQQLICGFPDQWKEFRERNGLFLARLPNLQATMDLAFRRSFTPKGPEDIAIYSLGRLCTEEFYEIGVLSANGYGIGALRLLRSLYERAVTLAFLSDNTDQVMTFLNYHAVAQYKLMQAIDASFGFGALSPEAVDRTKREYDAVKKEYEVTLCAECQTKRVNYTWHKLDVVSMAKKTIFAPIIIPGYYVPMSHAHSTVHALISRLEETGEGGLGFNPDPQPRQADEALMTAHNIMLGVIEVQKKYFGLDQLSEPLGTCLQDWEEIWIKKGDQAVPPSRNAAQSQ